MKVLKEKLEQKDSDNLKLMNEKFEKTDSENIKLLNEKLNVMDSEYLIVLNRRLEKKDSEHLQVLKEKLEKKDLESFKVLNELTEKKNVEIYNLQEIVSTLDSIVKKLEKKVEYFQDQLFLQYKETLDLKHSFDVFTISSQETISDKDKKIFCLEKELEYSVNMCGRNSKQSIPRSLNSIRDANSDVREGSYGEHINASKFANHKSYRSSERRNPTRVRHDSGQGWESNIGYMRKRKDC